jgi:endonuclease/exonuclease/phosphatase family metal-dependent hydrolase
VATWNIENFPKAGATTVERVRQVIEALDVDIVAVQEISTDFGGGPAFDTVVAALDGWGGARARSDRYQNLGFIYRETGGLQVTATYEIFAAGDYSREFPRSPFVLEATWNGAPVVVICNHLKASGNGLLDPDDAWDEETRRRDACLLLEEFVEAQFPAHRVFIVGDLNDQLTDLPPNNVFQNFLDDPAGWRFADLAIAQGPSDGWSYPGWPSHLDHILVTSELFAPLAAPGAVTVVAPLAAALGSLSKYDTEVSDHLPVVVRLVP